MNTIILKDFQLQDTGATSTENLFYKSDIKSCSDKWIQVDKDQCKINWKMKHLMTHTRTNKFSNFKPCITTMCTM